MGFTQTLTEMSIENSPAIKARSARTAENLIDIYKPTL
jgi:hypothetical protein